MENNKSIMQIVKEFLKERFDLNADKADQKEVHENMQKNVEFRGTNLWVLIFAIIVASVGLNINSTAVIIGAMLISPLMGPIMGIGYSLGINDFELLKKSFKNFAFSVGVSLLASTLYFVITPMSEAQSELLARTTPSTWDVMIATFGGLAGIVAASRRDRTSTVIPGVAIATALMPPLCTAGFGLATGRWEYFGGAFYLFFINAVFIAFATFFIVRFLKYERKQFIDSKREKQVRHYVLVILVITLVPSVIMTYSIVQRTMFEAAANKFSKDFFSGGVTHITYDKQKGSSIEVTMLMPLPDDSIGYARAKMEMYGLKDTRLVINQTTDSLGGSSLKYLLTKSTDILLEKDKLISELRTQMAYYTSDTIASKDIAREISVIQPGIEDMFLSRADVVNVFGESVGKKLVCVINMRKGVAVEHSKKTMLAEWLQKRTKAQDVDLLIDGELHDRGVVEDVVVEIEGVQVNP